MIIMREKGNSINLIAKTLGRSTAIVHRTLKNARWVMCRLKLRDMRKIPRSVREAHARWSPRTLRKYLSLWEAWILSSEGEPP